MYTISMGKALLILMFFSIFMVIGSGIYAQEMKSGEFRIENSTIDVSSQEDSASSYAIASTFGQLGGREFQRQGFVVRFGFEESQLVKPFVFGISKTNLIFEELKANKPIVRQTSLTVTSDKRPYEVAVIAEGPLQSKNGATIEHTKCDNVHAICLDSRPASWTSNKSYGFGYSFDDRQYQPFPDIRLGDKPFVTMSMIDPVKDQNQKEMFFKINMNKNQAGNNYQTIVNIIFMPLL